MRSRAVFANAIYVIGTNWGKVVNLTVKSTIKWIHGYFVEKNPNFFIRHPLIIITLSLLACDLPPFTLIKCLEIDFWRTFFCINNDYLRMCMLFIMSFAGSARITWWLPWQRFIESFMEASKPKCTFHAVLNGVYIFTNPCTASNT